MKELVDDIFSSGEVVHPTPFYCYSTRELARRAYEVSKVIDPGRIFFSMKANRNPRILDTLLSLGFGLDVSSEYELACAHSAGCPPERISIVGPWKPEGLLHDVRSRRYSKICVESRGELSRLRSKRKISTPIFVRVHLPVSRTDVAENMQAEDSQFGMSIDEISEILSEDVERDIKGFHYYGASDIVSQEAFGLAANNISQIAQELGLSSVQWGPGLGEPYDISHSIDNYFRDRASPVESLPDLAVEYEIGRYLVASCGMLILTVLDVKERGGKAIAITDGGITAFARTAITGAVHPIINLSARTIISPTLMEFRGPTCTPLDRFPGKAYFDSVKVGDKLALLQAGAYGEVLAFRGFVGFNTSIPVHFL